MMRGAARARSNIALVKYWGKRELTRNLPAVGSLSITLEELFTETSITFDSALNEDEFVLDGVSRADQCARVSACVDLLRQIAGQKVRARIESTNNFPTAAGLASSASGFAALVAATDSALGLNLSERELSILARRGSGSAARSIFGGFVYMNVGNADDGSDCYAEPLAGSSHWPLEVIVAITAQGPKAVSSASGMTRSAENSAYYGQWVATHEADMQAARTAIEKRDFEALAAVSESSCLKMHAAAMASTPPLIYWNGVTVECIRVISALRRDGLPVFFTIDAGPQVKAVCDPDAADAVREALASIPGVLETLRTGLGRGVELIDKAG